MPHIGLITHLLSKIDTVRTGRAYPGSLTATLIFAALAGMSRDGDF
jgi:hypothetical protein